MATTVGTAVVDIKFNTQSLKKELAGLGSTFSASGVSQAKSSGNAMGVAMGAGIGGGLGGALAGVGKILIDNLSEITKAISHKMITSMAANIVASLGKVGTATSKLNRLKFGWMAKLQRGLVGTSLSITKFIASLTIAKVALIALAVAAAAAFLKIGSAAVKSFGTVTEQLNRSRVAFRRFEGELEGTIARVKVDLGLGDQDIRQLVNDVQAALTPLLGSRELAAQKTQLLIPRIIDKASQDDKEYADIAQRFISGIQGQSRALLGISISTEKAKVQAELLKRGFEGSWQEATKLEKSLAIIDIIMRDSADAQDDAKNTMGSITNISKAIASLWKDTKSHFGFILDNVFGITSGLVMVKGLLIGINSVLENIAIVTALIFRPQAITNAFEAMEVPPQVVSTLRVIESIIKPLSTVLSGIGKGFDKLFPNQEETASNLIRIKKAILGIGQPLVDTFDGVKDDAKEIGKQIGGWRKGILAVSDIMQGQFSDSVFAAGEGTRTAFANDGTAFRPEAVFTQQWLETLKTSNDSLEKQLGVLMEINRSVARGNQNVFATN